MKVWTGQYEESEEITVVETTFKVQCHQRQKYRCSCHGAVVTAPGPDKLMPGGRYSVDFAVHTAIEKFCDHLPLERQARRMDRYGLDITSQTLWDQQASLAQHLEATWRHLRSLALAEDILHVDETGWRMMGSKKKSRWTLFGLTTPDLAVYHLVESKVRNLTGSHHNFHTHGFAFQHFQTELVDLDNPANNRIIRETHLENRDTVFLVRRPGTVPGRSWSITRLVTRFDDAGREGQIFAGGKVPTATTSGGWLLHCHVLEHSARGMMSFFQVDSRLFADGFESGDTVLWE